VKKCKLEADVEIFRAKKEKTEKLATISSQDVDW